MTTFTLVLILLGYARHPVTTVVTGFADLGQCVQAGNTLLGTKVGQAACFEVVKS